MTEYELAAVLEALAHRPPGDLELRNPVELAGDDLMAIVGELLERNLISAGHVNNAGGHLSSVWDVRVTGRGHADLIEFRRRHRGQDHAVERIVATPLEGKRKRRLEFMNALYELTNGSRTASVNMWALGEQLGWERSAVDGTVEYLEGEGLLEFVALGGELVITHLGVLEVEQALGEPDQGTEHFPPFNFIHVGSMVGSVIQQSSPGATQQVEVPSGEALMQLRALVSELRNDVLPALDIGDEDRRELEAELASADVQLGSSRPKGEQIRSNLGRVLQLLTTATVTAGTSVQLVQYVQRLHELLPGL